ncbi:MAG TPA: GspH/FimT family pseudopilin [Rhodanobacteraceae bacterium]|nr:GspH/FimT family pseudopilin [Rhodanobacteraceae bacterium]
MSPPSASSRVRGFSLVETVVTLSIVAVLAAFATPSMTSTMARHRVQDAASDLSAVLFKARADALTLNSDISVLPVDGNWAAGWRIADPVNTGKFLQVHEPAQLVAITLSGATSVIYQFNGRIRGGVGVKFNVSSSVAVGKSTTKCITVDPSGRPYTQDGACSG